MATGRLPDPNSAPVTAKGDLYTYSTVPAKLAVGSNGETLVADSSTSTGLRWGANYGFTAGKNKLINGDFRINQRSFTTTTADSTYTFDRWITERGGGTVTYSAQTFTAGSAPVSGYEGVNFLRIDTTGQSASGNYSLIDQRIEDVRTTAGATYTVSFWAKAASGTPKVGVAYQQNFGSGGSANVNGAFGDVTISTSWARYSVTATVASVSGKTIGAGSYFRTLLWTSAGSGYTTFTSIGIQNNTIDLWGIQVEQGSVATAFQTATGTLAGELVACGRYYQRFGNNPNIGTNGYNRLTGFSPASSSTRVYVLSDLWTPLRTSPTSIEYSGIKIYDGTTFYTITSLTVDQIGAYQTSLTADVASGLTQYRPYCLIQENSGAHYLAFNAEL